MSFLELDLGSHFGQRGFHDDNPLGFIDRKDNKMVRKTSLTCFLSFKVLPFTQAI